MKSGLVIRRRAVRALISSICACGSTAVRAGVQIASPWSGLASRICRSPRGQIHKENEDFMRGFLLALACVAALPAFADEGMWTFDNFPAIAVKQRNGADITPAWLDHVRLATVRLANCTASFVSPEGLMLTNHHCV